MTGLDVFSLTIGTGLGVMAGVNAADREWKQAAFNLMLSAINIAFGLAWVLR